MTFNLAGRRGGTRLSATRGNGEIARKKVDGAKPTCVAFDRTTQTASRGCSEDALLPMTNLLTVLPEFDVRPYTHILPSLEKALVSTADLLTLDALDVAKRAQVPPGEVKKLTHALLEGLHAELAGLSPLQQNGASSAGSEVRPDDPGLGSPNAISTLDDHLDSSLGGGILPGYLTEVVGER